MREIFAGHGMDVDPERMRRLLELDQQFSQDLSMSNSAEDDGNVDEDGALHCDHPGNVHNMACFRGRGEKKVVKHGPSSNIHGFAP